MDIYLKHYPEESIREKRFYNVGAASWRHPYWTNIDLASDYYSKVQGKPDIDFINYDLMSSSQLPIEDSSAEIVYSSHTVEHIPDEAIQNLCNQAYRILKTGGVFRVTAPCAKKAYKALRTNYIQFYHNCCKGHNIPKKSENLIDLFVFSIATTVSRLFPIETNAEKITHEEFNNLFQTYTFDEALDKIVERCDLDFHKEQPQWHINWISSDKLIRFMKNAGFSNPYPSRAFQSSAEVLRDRRYFDSKDRHLSVYVEAIR